MTEQPLDEVRQLRALAAAGAAELRTASQWQSWLRHAERFTGLGFTNTMLIWAQRPDAVVVASYAEWNRRGRQVIGGEHGVRLIGKKGVAVLFDVLQTQGKPVNVRRNAKEHGDGWEILTYLALRAGFRVAETGALDEPEIQWDRHVIRVASQDVPTLTEQVAHILVHDEAHRCDAVTGQVETSSVAFLIARRIGLGTKTISFPHVTTWAGADPRANPAATIARTGDRVLHAAAKAFMCIDANADPARLRITGPRLAGASSPAPRAERPADDEQVGILAEAARFFVSRLDSSPVPQYMAGRGFGPETLKRFGVGYAPGGWSGLTSHLRSRGFSEKAIEASGVAKRSSRGTLFDVFRDRVMFPVRSADGRMAGFIGRASPRAGEDVPKYLNSRETVLYKKGRVLFGLAEARSALASGAVPVIVEGPMDAIAVTLAGSGRYAGVAPCGTALTREQVSALVRAAPGCERVITLFDGDDAGRKAAIRAFDVLKHKVGHPLAAVLPAGQDPASLSAPALLKVLDGQVIPLADLVVDACLTKYDRYMDFIDGKFNALDAVAPLIAAMPAREVGRQVARTAERTGLTTAEVTDSVTRAIRKTIAGREPPSGPSQRPNRHSVLETPRGLETPDAPGQGRQRPSLRTPQAKRSGKRL
jgi:DNA primase